MDTNNETKETKEETKEETEEEEKEDKECLFSFARINKYFIFPFLCPILCMICNYLLISIIKEYNLKNKQFFLTTFVNSSYIGGGLVYFISWNKNNKNHKNLLEIKDIKKLSSLLQDDSGVGNIIPFNDYFNNEKLDNGDIDIITLLYDK